MTKASICFLKNFASPLQPYTVLSVVRFYECIDVYLQRNKTVESVLLPKARRDLEVAVEEWAVTHPDDPILLCGRDPVGFVDFTVNEHLATKEQERKEKVYPPPPTLSKTLVKRPDPSSKWLKSSRWSRNSNSAARPTRNRRRSAR